MWKLLEPRSTAARTSGTGWGAVEGAAGAAAIPDGRPAAPAGESCGRTLNSGGERGAAPARRLGVRVADHELRALEPFAVVDLGADEVLEAHRVDQQRHAGVLDRHVAFFDR